MERAEEIINTSIAKLCKEWTLVQSASNSDGCPRRLEGETIPHCYAGEEGKKKFIQMMQNCIPLLPEGSEGDEIALQIDKILKTVTIR